MLYSMYIHIDVILSVILSEKMCKIIKMYIEGKYSPIFVIYYYEQLNIPK